MNSKPIPALVALVLASRADVGARASDQKTDAGPSLPFKEGDVLGHDRVDKLRDFLPA